MSKYPKWWSDTITIYNRYEDPQTQLITWYRTVVEKVFWGGRGNWLRANDSVIDTDSIICRIRKDDRYLSEYDWTQLPNDQMSSYFTLFNGDIVVQGEVTDEIDEYTQGHRSNDIIEKYKKVGRCFLIDQVADNTGYGRGIPHYRISGK